MSSTTSDDNNESLDDLPQPVRERLLELPKGVWAGPLEDTCCVHCGHNSWAESDDDLGYTDYYEHYVDAFECLYCGAIGGWVTDARQDTQLKRWMVGALERAGEER